MKKKLMGAVALAMAMALTFGMTVCAEESPAPSITATLNEAAAVESQQDVVIGGKSVTIDVKQTELSAAKVDEAYTLVTDANIVKLIPNASNAGISAAFDLAIDESLDISAGITLTFKVPAVANREAGKEVYVLHQKKDGSWEAIKPESVAADGTIKAKFTSLSPVAVVVLNVKAGDTAKTTGNNSGSSNNSTAATAAEAASPAESPKTGEALPVAGILAVICLAGVAVCAKKIRYNR